MNNQPATQAKRSDSREDQSLKSVFSLIIDRKNVALNPTILADILVQNLYINPNVVDNKVLFNVLVEALVYYIRIWPGWGRSVDYFKGTLKYKEWYESFKQYLIYKTYNIIKNEQRYKNEGKKLNKPVVADKEKATLTDKRHYAVKPSAPYCLVINGPPNQLSNLIFMESENNIVMKQHDGRGWQPLSIKQLLNWPNVSVHLKFQDISIMRKNLHEFSRYLSYCGDVSPCPESDYISYVTTSEGDSTHFAYNVDYLELYVKQFLKVFGRIPGIIKERLEDINCIFKEFIEDIKEANVCNTTVCTFTSVCYNIGKMKYIRNKKLVNNSLSASGESKGINFYETLIPKIEYTLEHFKAVQDLSYMNEVSFSPLNIIETNMSRLEGKELQKIQTFVNNHCITYSCNFCNLSYNDANARCLLLAHLEAEHTSEQPVLCFKCKKQFEIINLTEDRWSHVCA